jgi:hypothetical protein
MIDVCILGIAMMGTAYVIAYIVALGISLIVLISSILEKEFGMFLIALFFTLLILGTGLFTVGLFI